ETVLIGLAGDLAAVGFGRCVERSYAAKQSRRALSFELLDEPEVGHLAAIADQEQVARLDVEVLEIVLFIHVVQSFGRIADIAQERVARNAYHAGSLALREHVVQALVRQLHDDDQLTPGNLDTLQRQHERMTNFLDTRQCLEFLFGAGALDVQRVQVAVNEFDGLEQAAGRFTLPYLAEATAAQRLDEPITRQGLGIRFANKTHESILPFGRAILGESESVPSPRHPTTGLKNGISRQI